MALYFSSLVLNLVPQTTTTDLAATLLLLLGDSSIVVAVLCLLIYCFLDCNANQPVLGIPVVGILFGFASVLTSDAGESFNGMTSSSIAWYMVPIGVLSTSFAAWVSKKRLVQRLSRSELER